jgi:DNA-binding transcriptional LysR family regulator
MHGVDDVEGLRRGHVSIGTTPSLAATLLPKVLAKFHGLYPGVQVTVTERGSNDLAGELAEGTLDLALVIMPLRRAGLEGEVLATEELVVIVAPGHPLSTKGTIKVSDLAGMAMVMFKEGYDLRPATTSAFERAGIPATVGIDGAEIGSVHAYVEAGLGAAIVPAVIAAAHPELVTLRLSDPAVARQIGLARTSGHVLSRAAAALAQEITGYLRNRH